MANETVGKSEQDDMDKWIHEAECRLEPLRVELIETFEGNINVEYRCKTYSMLWHEHKNKQVAGCGVKKSDVPSDTMLQSLLGEETRLDSILQVRDEITGTKASVRELTREVEELGTKRDNSDSSIVQLKTQLTDLKTSKGITENKNQQLEQEKTDLQKRKNLKRRSNN
jgi:hypothetical protein